MGSRDIATSKEEQGVEELVLDLRMNGGGYLYAAKVIAR